MFRRPDGNEDWSEVSWGLSYQSPIAEKPYTYIDAPDVWLTCTLLIWTIVTNTYIGDPRRSILLAGQHCVESISTQVDFKKYYSIIG